MTRVDGVKFRTKKRIRARRFIFMNICVPETGPFQNTGSDNDYVGFAFGTKDIFELRWQRYIFVFFFARM